MALRAGDAIFQILIQVKVLSCVKESATFQIRADVPIWKGYDRNISRKLVRGI